VIEKRFKLDKSQIVKILVGEGGCLVTDRIMVDGCRVGYMYREMPRNTMDSGWRFFAGDETEGYMANPRNHGVYDLNTLVNYDSDVIPFLRAEVGSEFERNLNGILVRIK